MPAISEFNLRKTYDQTARLVAADAAQENGDDASAYILRNTEFTAIGLHARVVSGRRSATRRKAAELLWAGDWKGFAALTRRCKSIRVRVSTNAFGYSHGYTPPAEVCVAVSCRGGTIAFIRIPGDEPGDKWQGMRVADALALAGLSLDPNPGRTPRTADQRETTMPCEHETTVQVVVTVTYWRGTTQVSGTATSYAGAMELASRNQNAYSPRFYHGERKLLDDGQGLAYEDELDAGRTVYAV